MGDRDTEKEAKGSTIGILFKQLIPKNQQESKPMHMYLVHKRETPKELIVLNAEANLDIQFVSRFIGKERRNPVASFGINYNSLAFTRFPCLYICHCCGLSFPLA